MKKQYMQPQWRITVLEENFIATSGETVVTYDSGGFLVGGNVESWF